MQTARIVETFGNFGYQNGRQTAGVICELNIPVSWETFIETVVAHLVAALSTRPAAVDPRDPKFGATCWCFSGFVIMPKSCHFFAPVFGLSKGAYPVEQLSI